ncbi:MAG: hypothetical protein WD749_06910 [Phycisphaerales bacterium]
MTTIARETIARETGARAAPGAAAGAGAGGAARPVLTLVWDLPSGAAGIGAGPATVEVAVERDLGRAWVRAGERRVELARDVPVMVEFDGAAGLWHADAPGLLAATWRAGGGGAGVQVLYARTRIIERLGVRGGTYELRRQG